MQRAVAGVVMGLVMAFMVAFLLYPAAYLALGPETAFEPNSFHPTQLWMALNIVIGLIAAGTGGFTCATISRSSRPPLVLALLAVVLGLVSAVVVIRQPDPGMRTEDVSRLNAILSARHPMWAAFLNPVIGAVGVLFGAKLRQPERLPV